MIETRNINEAKKLLSKEKRLIVVKSQDNLFNRNILEYGKFDVLLSPESGKRKDGLKFLDSGLNGVFARIAARNNVAIGINLSEIQGLEKKEKAKRTARIMKNIYFCRKAGVCIAVTGGKNRLDYKGLLISLGASSNQAKEAISF